MIRSDDNFDIIKIKKHSPGNIKKFVNQVYSFDYAPLIHLNEKTKYLRNTPAEVCFIYVLNKRPDDDYIDEGKFRHKESSSMKRLKNEIRLRYNPRVDGEMTHDHVVHATDCEEHVDKMLRLNGYSEGIKHFRAKNIGIDIPYYLGYIRYYEFKRISIDSLYCGVVCGSANEYYSDTLKIDSSPQYIALLNGMDVYREYLDKYLGYALQSDYSVDRYQNLIDEFDINKAQNDFICAVNRDGKYVVVDGLHRVSVLKYKGINNIRVCVLYG